MKPVPLAAALWLGALAAALPVVSAEPPKGRAELVGGSGLVKVDRAPFGQRADAAVPNLQAFGAPALARRSTPFVRPPREAMADRFEVVFFARTRPVRIRIVTLHEGKTLTVKWEETLKTLFAAFDRDGDGRLNRHEAELIFSKNEVQTMLEGNIAFRAQSGGPLPTLEALDRDGDGSVSFDEFAHYYDDIVLELAQTREAPFLNTPDLLTPELFARLDTDGDQKLSEAELRNAEKLLIPLDGDEDECVSAFEITSNPIKGKIPVLAPGGAGMGMMMERPNGPPPSAAGDILSVRGPLPGSVVPKLLKRYDKDGDFELSRGEIAFPKEVFDKIDANGDGQLDAKELDAWRAGPPDFTVELNTAAKAERCTAKLMVEPKGHLSGVEFVKPTTPDRLIVRVFGQLLDIGANPSLGPPGAANDPYGSLFPVGKDFLEEKDLLGPQYQLLRVVFEPADWNGDGKLTRAEFGRYIELQNLVTRQALGLTHQTRVPNLFTLLDQNGDGKLSVKELRGAYERLTPLEPSGGKQVTRAILQPSATLRLGHRIGGANDPNHSGYGVPSAVPAAGPVWFRKMDRNGDGDVSRAEFLGSKAAFDAIDANKDGLISQEEAEAYDKRTRRGGAEKTKPDTDDTDRRPDEEDRSKTRSGWCQDETGHG